MKKNRAGILDAKFDEIRRALRSLQKEIDKSSSKFCIQINGIVIDLDRLEKESKKNVVNKEKRT